MAVISNTVVTGPAAWLNGTTNDRLCDTVVPYGCKVPMTASLVDMVVPLICHVSVCALCRRPFRV
jgi:hypothetical protein